MLLRHIVAATDESDAGRQAVRTAMDLASRTSARISIVRVIAVEAARHLVGVGNNARAYNPAQDEAARNHLRRWLQADVLAPNEADAADLAIGSGNPGIEICRFAERAQADLLVLGRKRHSPMMRLLLGDTADAVARRSRVPCLFVPQGAPRISKVLVALDGSERGMNVLGPVCDFAAQVGASLQAITVERGPANEPLHLVSTLPVTRSSSLQARVREVLIKNALPDVPLVIRRGDILEWVMAEAQQTGADVLALGYHRGGAPGVIEGSSTARRLAHAAPCGVLTIPL